MKTDDISDTTALLQGGGGAPVVPSRISVVLVEETKAGDTSRPECPCDDQDTQPLAGPNGPRGGAVSEGDTQSLCGGGGGGGRCPLALFRFLVVDVTKTPTLSVEGPRSVLSWISVVLVDGTMAGDTPGRECRVRMGFGDSGLARRGQPVCLWVVAMQDCRVLGRHCPPLMLPEGSGRWCPLGGSSSVGTANPVGSDDPVVAGNPIGPCETLVSTFP